MRFAKPLFQIRPPHALYSALDVVSKHCTSIFQESSGEACCCARSRDEYSCTNELLKCLNEGIVSFSRTKRKGKKRKRKNVRPSRPLVLHPPCRFHRHQPARVRRTTCELGVGSCRRASRMRRHRGLLFACAARRSGARSMGS